MGRYLINRLLISIPTLIATSMVIFGLLALAPGDPLGEFALNPSITAEVRENLRISLGLDQPLPIRYVKWFYSFLTGNWGWSFTSLSPVRDLVAQRIGATLAIVGLAYLWGMLAAFPLGVISAIKRYSLTDQAITLFAFLGFSMPTYFTGLLFIIVFSVNLGWFPFVYDSTVQVMDWNTLIQQFKQSIMPITVLGLWEMATLMRFVRSATLDSINQDYVRTARSKGLQEWVVINRHVLRNTLIPVVTLIALRVPTIFAGALITEQVFRVPGIGSLLISAIQQNDTPVVMSITFIYGILVVIFNLVADVLYGFLDPRVSYSK